jgi:hypothetical protein
MIPVSVIAGMIMAKLVTRRVIIMMIKITVMTTTMIIMTTAMIMMLMMMPMMIIMITVLIAMISDLFETKRVWHQFLFVYVLS